MPLSLVTSRTFLFSSEDGSNLRGCSSFFDLPDVLILLAFSFRIRFLDLFLSPDDVGMELEEDTNE